MEMNSIARWGRRDGSKRREVKRERDCISCAVREEKDGKGGKGRKKMEAKLVAQWGAEMVVKGGK